MRTRNKYIAFAKKFSRILLQKISRKSSGIKTKTTAKLWYVLPIINFYLLPVSLFTCKTSPLYLNFPPWERHPIIRCVVAKVCTVIHEMNHTCSSLRTSTRRNLPFSSFIATKPISIQRGICPFICSCYETQIPATRTPGLTSQARGAWFAWKQICESTFVGN